jgi:hypothetical protein
MGQDDFGSIAPGIYTEAQSLITAIVTGDILAITMRSVEFLVKTAALTLRSLTNI